MRCGNGDLSWSIVGPVMYQKLHDLPIDIEIYAPFGTNPYEISDEFLGKMISLSVTPQADLHTDRFSQEEQHAVNTTIDLFRRVKSTEQAEMITTVLYSYDQLVLDKNQISDLDVYNYVFDWKPHLKNQKEFEVCDTIQNLAMLSLMNITHSGKLQDTTLL